MTASGPFAMGTGSLSRSERARRGGGMGGGGGGGLVHLRANSAAHRHYMLTSSLPTPRSHSFAPGSSSAADSKSDMKPLRSDASYRNPDKLRDAEQYSDQEDDVEIVDMGNVAELDELAPRSLPRMQEKDKKKGKGVVKKEKGKGKEGAGIVKPDPEDEEASDRARLQGSESGSGSASSTPPVIGGVVKKKKAKKEEAGMPGAPSDNEDDDGDAGAEEVVRGADALDLSESEEEEMMDDLADDFVFDDTHSDGGGGDNNRLYLFQFPQMFPKFKAAKAKPIPTAKPESDAEASSSTVQASSSSGGGPPASALSSSPPGGSKDKPKRSVAFAEGVKNGTATPPDNRDRKPTPAELSAGMKRSAMDNSSHLDPLSNSSSQSGPEGMIGRLQIYKDGRVEMHFGSPTNPLVMEVAGGSQSSFLQDVALLDAKEKRATVLGEVHRKFTVSPGVEGMLRDWEGWCAGERGGGEGEDSESSSDEEEVGVKREVKREASARA